MTTKKREYSGENNAINQLIIEVRLINPISEIIAKLKGGVFRDCDISWLDDKLQSFTLFACETLNINIPTSSLERDTMSFVMNDYCKSQYITRFTTLLNYFKTV